MGVKSSVPSIEPLKGNPSCSDAGPANAVVISSAVIERQRIVFMIVFTFIGLG